jgi:hypothetical protein
VSFHSDQLSQFNISERSFAEPCENLHVKEWVYSPPSPRFKSGSDLKREENRFSDAENAEPKKIYIGNYKLKVN